MYYENATNNTISIYKEIKAKKAHRESGLISEADYLKRGYSQHDAAYNLYFILYISV